MEKQRIATGSTPTIIVEAQGDLVLKGDEEALEVVVKSDTPEEVSLSGDADQVSLRCTGDCSVRVPRQADVRVSIAQGDATLKNLGGSLEIDVVHGDLSLRGVGDVHIQMVHGDLSAKDIAGDLIIETASGNTAIQDVQGDFTVSGMVGGNLRLDDVNGDAKATSHGNITLRLDPVPGQVYTFEADGNLFCRLSEDPSVEISIPRAASVMVNIPGMESSAPAQPPYALTLGEGDASLTLSALGNVILDSQVSDWAMEDFSVQMGRDFSGIGEQISQQINQQLESQMQMIEKQLEAQIQNLSFRLGGTRMPEEEARRIEERARQASERATARAQERLARAQERLEHKMAAARRRIEQKERSAERHAGRRGRSFLSFGSTGFPPPPPSPAGEPVTEDSRLMILRMLEQKQISVEEAEQLLGALEGKETQE